MDSLAILPTYFKKNGYQNPSDATKCPFQLAKGTDLHLFEWLKTDEEAQAAFNATMAIPRIGKKDHWFDFYPVEEKFRQSADAPLLVDIGGGMGHDIADFHTRFPNLPGRLILEDLPHVIDDIKSLDQSIERVSHDFFTPQPVKGSRAYYLRSVLHDWPDNKGKEILENIRSAMAEDSLLLLHEFSMPEINAPLFVAQTDLLMMAGFAGSERTQKQWETLLDSAGFKLQNAYKPKDAPEGASTLFEAVLKE